MPKTEFRAMTGIDMETLLAESVYAEQKNNPLFEYTESFVYEHDGVLLGGGGFVMITETTAWAWAMVTSAVKSNIITAFRVLREYLEQWCTDHGIIRLQAYVREDFPEGQRLVTHLGFQSEGEPMNDFCGKGVAAQLYVRFFN